MKNSSQPMDVQVLTSRHLQNDTWTQLLAHAFFEKSPLAVLRRLPVVLGSKGAALAVDTRDQSHVHAVRVRHRRHAHWVVCSDFLFGGWQDSRPFWVTTVNIEIMENKMETTIVCCGYIGIMENKMETTIQCKSLQRKPINEL